MTVTRTLLLVCAVLGVAFASTALAEDPEDAQIYDARGALEQLKLLTGKWVDADKPDEESENVNFRVIGNDSTVVATFFPDTQMEMISVFHMDGPNELIHTHYCALGNQPMMRFEKSEKPGEIKFVFAGGTNFDPEKDLHVHEGTIRILSADEIESEFTAYGDGKPVDTTKHKLTRKQADVAAK